MEPMRDVLTQELDKSLPRHVYLLTDGAVSNTQEILSLIRDHRDRCRVHTFGIGSGASTELIKDCAKAGQGHFTFIDDLKEIERKVMDSL